MSLYILPAVILALLAGAAWLVWQWVAAQVKHSRYIASAGFDVQPTSVGSHDSVRLTAKVTAKSGHQLTTALCRSVP